MNLTYTVAVSAKKCVSSDSEVCECPKVSFTITMVPYPSPCYKKTTPWPEARLGVCGKEQVFHVHIYIHIYCYCRGTSQQLVESDCKGPGSNTHVISQGVARSRPCSVTRNFALEALPTQGTVLTPVSRTSRTASACTAVAPARDSTSDPSSPPPTPFFLYTRRAFEGLIHVYASVPTLIARTGEAKQNYLLDDSFV